MPHISIVIPTLNEGKNIRHVMLGVKEILRHESYEIIVVDGGSSDRTVQLARGLGAKILTEHIGKGNGLIKGLAAAKGSVVVAMDADMSNEPKELKLLIDGIEIGYDVCMGSRFITGGGSEDMPLIRVMGNKFFVLLVNLLFRANYSDMCYGYRSFRKSAISKLRLREKGFGIETEINIQAAKKHMKVLEVPSNEKRRNAGIGKLHTFRDGYVILKAIGRGLFS